MTTSHIVAHAALAWGHTKPILILMSRIAKRRPASAVTFTILTSEPMLSKVNREIELMPDQTIAERINVIDIGEPPSLFEPNLGFIPAFQNLWNGKAVSVTYGKNSSERVLPRPSVVLLDPMCGYAIPVIKEVSAGTCDIYAWFTSNLSSFLYLLGPEHLGGLGDLAAKIETAAKEQGKTPIEVADNIYKRVDGQVIRVPGVPPMHTHDYFPQESSMPFSATIIPQYWHRNTLACDGIMTITATAFEDEAITAARSWLQGLGLDTYVIGPLEDVPQAVATNVSSSQSRISEEDAKILSFLDDMQAKHGNQSVIYLAFGTLFYPKDPSKLYAFIDEVIASGTPILWGHASPFAQIPQELTDRFATMPNAYHASWTPQRAVLRHPATGWYIAHGGWNGVQEALSLNVPMVMWPFDADQPTNTAMLTRKHRAAFELFSIRTGEGARQPYSSADQAPVDFSVDGVRREARELLRKLKGVEGAEVRRNAEALGAEMAKSWREGGEAVTQIETFLRKYVH